MRSDVCTPAEGVGVVPVATLVIWAGCLAVGVAGLRLRYPSVAPPRREPEPVAVEALNVDVTNGPAPPPQPSAPPAPAEEAPSPPSLPPPVSQAPATPAAAPPLAALASPAPDETAKADAPAAPQRLTFGEGEGRQPAPPYPREAALAHQQGTVVVRFTVGTDGRVTRAEAAVPCPAALLNQAAVRAVRETWRFPAGPVRAYEVAIEFQLKAR